MNDREQAKRASAHDAQCQSRDVVVAVDSSDWQKRVAVCLHDYACFSIAGILVDWALVAWYSAHLEAFENALLLHCERMRKKREKAWQSGGCCSGSPAVEAESHWIVYGCAQGLAGRMQLETACTTLVLGGCCSSDHD